MLSLESIQQNVAFLVVLVTHVLLIFQVPPMFINLKSIIYKEGWSSMSLLFYLGTYTCFHYTWQPKTTVWNILLNLSLPAKIRKSTYDRLYRKSANM